MADIKTIFDQFNNANYFSRIDNNHPLEIHIGLDEKGRKANDTVSRRAIWNENPKLIDESGNMPHDIVRTLTTKQDRNPNSGNLYLDYDGNTKSKFRYLTPRECFLLMGFDEDDFEKIIAENPEIHKGTKLFPRDKLIRMAGNSIPVNLLEQVFSQVVDIDMKIASKWVNK